MRVTGLESDPGRIKNLPLDPEVLRIIEKLPENSLLVEKILMGSRSNSRPLIQLQVDDANSQKRDTAQRNLIKQLDIPLVAAKVLSSVTLEPASRLLLNVELTPSRQVAIELGQQSTIDSQFHRILKLFFGQAQLVGSETLQLSNLLKSSTMEQPVNAGSVLTSDNMLNSPTSLPTNPSLKQAISYFLKSKPVDSLPLSASLNQMFQQTKDLVASINGNQPKVGNLNSSLTLDSEATTELLTKSGRFTSENKAVSDIAKLLLQINQLKQSLDFSKNNKQLRLESRITSSGNFLESNLSRNMITEAPEKSPPSNKPESILNRQSSSVTDLKLLSLNLKQTLESLSQYYNNGKPAPILSSQLLNAIAKSSVFAQLQNAETGQADPATQLATGKTGTADTSQKIESYFDSASLRKFFSANQPLQIKDVVLNTKQQELLLNTQKQLINDLLSETNQMFNKIETNQLLSLRNESPQLHQYLLDLPIFHDEQVESFELLLESKQENSTQKSAKSWTVTVRFDLEPLGPMFARINFKNDRISTRFFAKEDTTSKLLVDNIDHLKQSLFLAGLDIDEVVGQQGIVPDELIANDEHSVDVHV